MKIFYDCLPCIIRHTIELSDMVTEDAEKKNHIIKEAIKLVHDFEEYRCSPEITRDLHNLVKKYIGNEDIYRKIKIQDIEAAKQLVPMLEEYLDKSKNRLYDLLKISAIGNIIDSAMNLYIRIEDCIQTELVKEFSLCDIKIFEEKLKKAKRILIIGDNSGESVFDSLLAKHFSDKEVFYAVRNEPVLNDVTITEAVESGLDKCATVISSGSGAPGLLLEEASDEFLKIFNSADIVISKGQGNYEALTPCTRDIFFLLKAKCKMVADDLGVNLGGYVFKFAPKI